MNKIVQFKNKNPTKNKPFFLKVQQILNFLCRNTSVVFNSDELFEKCFSNSISNPLILKLGIDASGYSLHLGHLVPLLKIKEFLLFFHCKVFLIIGDMTTLAHDPGRSFKTYEDIVSDLDIKIKNIKQQLQIIFGEYIDKEIVNIVRNSTWLAKTTLNDLLIYSKHLKIKDLLNKFKVTNMALSSAIYPILQGIDSLVLKADIEFGGLDQLTNVLFARELTIKCGNKKQIAFLMPLIPGKDNDKMSKSKKNSINLSDNSRDILSNLISLNDNTFIEYFRCLGLKMDKINNITEFNNQKRELSKQFLKDILKRTDIIDYKYVKIDVLLPQNIVELCIICLKTIKKKEKISKLYVKRLINQKCVFFNQQLIYRIDSLIEKHGKLKIGKELFEI